MCSYYTKLQIPSPNTRILHRSKLIERLSEGRNRRLILITGPAGSGKTTLASHWLKNQALNELWYSIDIEDNECDVFFRYLLSALGNINKRIEAAIRPRLQKRNWAAGKDIIPLMIQHFMDLPEDIYLVLDNYHLIISEEIHKTLSNLLEYMPSKMHMVIISRSKVPFPVSNLKIRNHMIALSSEDMKFSEEESEQFLTDNSPTMSTDLARKLAEIGEGWLGGLQLFRLFYARNGTVNDLNEFLNMARKETAAYFIEEVVNTQPKKVKQFLYATAFLDKFNADLCQEVSGQSDAMELLDYVYKSNLFLSRLNARENWFRYHQLLSEAIRDHVSKSSTDFHSQIHRKAAVWFARNDFLEEALGHAFASEDFEFAADLLEDYWFSIYDRLDHSLCLWWLAKLPREIFMKRALLRFYECAVRIESYQLADIAAVLSEIENKKSEAFEQYEGPKKELCQDLLEYYKHILPYFSEPKDLIPDHQNRTFEMLFSKKGLFSGVMKLFEAEYNVFFGNMSRADQALKEASSMIFPSDSAWGRLFWLKVATDVELLRGCLYRTEAMLHEGFFSLETRGISDSPLKNVLHLQMSWICYYRNDLEMALEHADKALKSSDSPTGKKSCHMISVLLSFIYLAMGEKTKAVEWVEKSQNTSRKIGEKTMIADSDAAAAFVFIKTGDLGWVEEWINQRSLSLDEPFSCTFSSECLIHAEYFYIQGRFQEADRILKPLQKYCMEKNILKTKLEIDILYSAILYKLNFQDKAKITMKQALSFAQVEGFIQPFVNYSQFISPILTDICAISPKHRRSAFLKTIMHACNIDLKGYLMTDSKYKAEGVEPLTPREIEVLKLLADGYKYREIAEKNFISIETVKTHAKNIYNKLKVNNRSHAIRKAERMMLF